MIFGPNTKIHLKCDVCSNEETVLLKDLPHTPGRNFIFLDIGHCVRCLNAVTGIIRPEDVDTSLEDTQFESEDVSDS